MSLNDLGMNFSNSYGDMINQENVEAIEQAKQLTAIKQQGADNAALAKQQSDNVADYVGDGEDVFGMTLAGKYINDEMLKGIHEKGVKGFFKGEADRLVKSKLGKGINELSDTASKAKDGLKSAYNTVKNIKNVSGLGDEGDVSTSLETGDVEMDDFATNIYNPGEGVPKASVGERGVSNTEPIKAEPEVLDESTINPAYNDGLNPNTPAPKRTRLSDVESEPVPEFDDKLFDQPPSSGNVDFANISKQQNMVEPLAEDSGYRAKGLVDFIKRTGQATNANETGYNTIADALQMKVSGAKPPVRNINQSVSTAQGIEDRFNPTGDSIGGDDILKGAPIRVPKSLSSSNSISSSQVPDELTSEAPTNDTFDTSGYSDLPQNPEEPPPDTIRDPLTGFARDNENTNTNINSSNDNNTNNSNDANNSENDVNNSNDTNTNTNTNTNAETQSNTNELKNVDKDGNIIEDAGTIGKYAGYGLKMAGAIPGAIDAFEDIKDGKLEGDNWQEKTSNALTIASTVMDFIPGLEAFGAIGGLFSAGLGAWGDTKDQENLKNKDKAQTVAPVKAQLVNQVNFHQLGMVSNFSNNSMNMIHGSSSF